MKKLLFWSIPIGFILLLLVLPKWIEYAQATTLEYHDYQISGKITNKKEVKDAFDVIQSNLAAVSTNDSVRYSDTLVKEARKESKKEIEAFFQKYSVQQTILEVKVKKQTKQEIVFIVQQKSVSQQKSNYRNHIATAAHTLVKENQQWKIAETIMSDTKFI